MPNTLVPAAATGLPTPHPRLAELIERAKLRQKIARAVTRLIAVMDAIDADPELEETNDREHVDEDGGDILDGADDDQVDGEPSLGAPNNHHDQQHWSQGGRRDIELLGAEENVHA